MEMLEMPERSKPEKEFSGLPHEAKRARTQHKGINLLVLLTLFRFSREVRSLTIS